MTHPIAKICAALAADDAGVRLDADEMREVIEALDERERAIGRERTRADAAEVDRDALRAECERLRAIVSPTAATWAPVITSMQCEAYSLASVLRTLVAAAEHLMHDHNCDAHGWEVTNAAMKAGRAALDALDAQRVTP